jgi:hypothetical protein
VLQRSSFDEHDEFVSAIQEILRGVDRETLDAVYQKWIMRLHKSIDGNGEHVE